MKSKKKKEKDYSKSMRIGFIILFIFAFIILVDKQRENEETLGDILDNGDYFRSVPYKKIVVRDMEAIYPRYYVFFLDNTDNTYVVHSFNYYQTDSQYELELNNHLKYVVDYDYSDYMVRYVFSKGEGKYNELFEEIGSIIDSDNYRIY